MLHRMIHIDVISSKMPKFVAKCSVAMIKKTNDGKMAKSVYKKII